MSHHPSYLRVFLTFARNSLVRDMTFRWNFIIEAVSSTSWMMMNLGFYLLIFQYTTSIGVGEAAWGRYEFFVFIATTMLVNSIVQAFFMPNAQEFSELIRTGGLDFALLKPIDTQFLISLQRINWSSFANLGLALVLLIYSLWKLTTRAADPLVLEPFMFLLYPIYVVLGVGILYSLMIALAATSVWLGRNQSLYNFWFYITNFSRYPMEIYSGNMAGHALRNFFTFIIPVLVVVNVPARMLARPLSQQQWPLAIFALVAVVLCLVASRWVFGRSLLAYRSASS